MQMLFWGIKTDTFLQNHFTLKWNVSQIALYYQNVLYFLPKKFFIDINYKSDYQTVAFPLNP